MDTTIDSSNLFYYSEFPCNKGHFSKRYKSTNQCVDCQKEYGIIHKRRYRLNRYGLTEEQYENILKEQNYVCAICEQSEVVIDGKTKEIKTLSVDHSHDTDEVRGLLCTHCNQGLGKFKDSPKLLKQAIEYLLKHNPWLE